VEFSLKDSKVFSKLPVPFFEQIVRDIPAAAWGYILDSYPTEKKKILEGYSSRKGKPPQIVHRAPVLDRIGRELQTNPVFFQKVLTRWRVEKSTPVSYLAMFASEFISRNL
jgi:hypothetical protein